MPTGRLWTTGFHPTQFTFRLGVKYPSPGHYPARFYTEQASIFHQNSLSLFQVNGVNIEGMRHAEVVAFIKNGGEDTRLLVVDPDTDEHFKRIGIIPTVYHLKGNAHYTTHNAAESSGIVRCGLVLVVVQKT